VRRTLRKKINNKTFGNYDMNDIAQILLKETCNSMSVFKSNLGYEVRMPSIYPNGEQLTVIIDERGESKIFLHDGGFAMMAVASLGMSFKNKYMKEILHHASAMGCEFKNGRVYRVCDKKTVAISAMAIANVCLFITSLAVKKIDKQDDFTKKVRSALIKNFTDKAIKNKYKVIGHSGGEYEVTSAIVSNDNIIPDAIIEAVSSPQAVAFRFRHLYDIKMNPDYSMTDTIAVYDENENFSSSDLTLLQSQSNVVAYEQLMSRVSSYV